MPRVVKVRPTSPGRRHVIKVIPDEEVFKGRPERSLVSGKSKRISGRNNQGRITVRCRGGGSKKLYREIDFRRNKRDSIKARVERIEYDPNRTAYIALICYVNGQRNYIIAPKGLKSGDVVESGPEAPIKVGNCLPMVNIPVGTVVHCVELKSGKGAQLARSAGASVRIVAREGAYVSIRLRSGEVRRVRSECRATVGEVGNEGNSHKAKGKAGASRWVGRRPKVRGVAMNPVDHPHGGGEGRTSGGGHPVSPWGQLAKGFKTRSNKRTDDDIITDRRKK